MIADTLSILLVGDSQVEGYRNVRCPIKVENLGVTLDVLMNTHFIGAAYAALEMVVRFPGGREDLNPSIRQALTRWPGFGLKDKPLTRGATIQKELVLSFGTTLSYYDPAFEFGERIGHASMLRSDIDFLLPGRPDLPVDPKRILVPLFLIREMYETLLAPMERALELLMGTYAGHLWVLGSPPPAEDHSALQALINDRAARASQPPIDFPAPSVMLKAWLVVKDCMAELCRKVGCKFIDCTPVAAGSRGYFKPEFVHDGVHGNYAYGDAMTRHLMLTLITAAVEQSA